MKPAAGVVVAARAKIDGKALVEQDLTDRYGKFRISGLAPGQWQVQGVQGESQTGEEVMDLKGDVYNVNLMVSRKMNKADWLWGRIFVGALGVLLLALVAVYLWTHAHYVPAQEPELAAMVAQVDQVRKIAAATDSSKDDSLATLRTAVVGLGESWNSASGTLRSITEGQKVEAKLLLTRSETAVAAKNAKDAELALENLKSVLQNQRSIYLWSEPPSSYLEVLFWSLAGILVSLLVTCGYYLRRKRFYVEGIWMHLSHLLAVPFLALVVVFLLSQLKLTVQIDQSEIALDITDPRLLAALSFIIAARPWGMIDFVREASGSIFGSMRRQLGSGGEPPAQSGSSTPAQP